ncbi:peptide synthetase [Pseudomonas oryzihabitans]|nr:peptide synthetase [Pseudomonas psychrotolerans]
MEALAELSLSLVEGAARPDLCRDEVLADLFEATAARVPERPALLEGERSLSYGELDAWADRAASRLLAAGAGPGRVIGLWLPRGMELLVMQLAIAKTGAAWLPCDAETPADRVALCLEDAQAVGVITGAPFADLLARPGLQCWTPNALSAPLATDEPLRRRGSVSPDNLAYLIYTSGSTGKPKGIGIRQDSICHFLRSENSLLGIEAGDRVYQGFSVAFDMSFEEIWISYLVGATLWLAPREITADPEALAQALTANRISVLHVVPTLLALLPEDVPSLRLINLGGEMCPEPLVARWSRPQRRLFNTYGPSEATVSASLAQLQPGEPVTIGRPLPNYSLLVVPADASKPLALLPRDQVGELCITGPGVADGYLGRPELTAEKFLPNPWSTGSHDLKLYRTGDLARVDAHGQVHCLGRVDDQVKIRGYRVELGEIEATLARQPGVGTVAVVLREEAGVEQLVAFMVGDGGPLPRSELLRTELAGCLPLYMVPSRFEWLSEMPRLNSGKIDRKQLRARPLTIAAVAPVAAASGALGAVLAATAELFPGQPLQAELDFFDDLGGHSLFAARLVSRLRQDPRYASATVKAVYAGRTLGAIAEALEADAAAAGQATATEAWTPPSRWRRWRCGLAQAVALPPLLTLRLGRWLAPFLAFPLLIHAGATLPLAMLTALSLFILAIGLEFAVALVGKRLTGRLEAGRYPLWGLTYYRWWLGERFLAMAPAYLLSGSPLARSWLRLLGAKVGDQAFIGTITLRVPELLTLGQGVSLGNGVNFENARVLRGELLLGAVTLGQEAQVGSYAILEGDTAIGASGRLQAQSALRAGQRIPTGRNWGGAPAHDQGAVGARVVPPAPSSRTKHALLNTLYALSGLAVSVLFFMPLFPLALLIDELESLGGLPWWHTSSLVLDALQYGVLALPLGVVSVALTLLGCALARRLIMPRLDEGQWSIDSLFYWRKWLANLIQESALQSLQGLYATVYSALWYRLLGARVGRDAEISTAAGPVSSLLELGDETFIADAVMLGDEQIAQGWITLKRTSVARRSFVGNGAYVADGCHIPEDALVGVLGRLDEGVPLRQGETWLGSPAVRLPARETLTGYPESLTFRPAPWRRLVRGLIEALRIVLPTGFTVAAGCAIAEALVPLWQQGAWLSLLGETLVAGSLFALASFGVVLALKWLVVGRYRPRSAPMWTFFVWRSEAITSLYETLAVPNLLATLRGTPWLPLALRLLGARLGRGTYLDTTDLTEFDCVRLGDHGELNALAGPQTHLFEDRVMKVGQVELGAGVNLAPRSVVLYGAQVGDNVELGPLSLVMKGETLPARSRWEGNPVQPRR